MSKIATNELIERLKQKPLASIQKNTNKPARVILHQNTKFLFVTKFPNSVICWRRRPHPFSFALATVGVTAAKNCRDEPAAAFNDTLMIYDWTNGCLCLSYCRCFSAASARAAVVVFPRLPCFAPGTSLQAGRNEEYVPSGMFFSGGWLVLKEKIREARLFWGVFFARLGGLFCSFRDSVRCKIVSFG